MEDPGPEPGPSNVSLTDNDSSQSEENTESSDEEFVMPVSCAPKRHKASTIKAVVTPGLAAALDRTKTTDRSATYILTETAASLGHDASNLSISRSTIHRSRTN
jgi:CRISPR/Cas system-associated protein Csm6